MSNKQMLVLGGLLALIAILILGLLLVQMQSNRREAAPITITQIMPTSLPPTSTFTPAPTATLTPTKTFVPSYTLMPSTIESSSDGLPTLALPTKSSP